MRYKDITKKPKLLECYFCRSELTEADSYITVDIKVQFKIFKQKVMCNTCQIINEDVVDLINVNNISSLTVLYKRKNTPNT